MRAQRMGRTDYAVKCFQEALALQEDFETMGYLVQVYIQTNRLDEARRLLERMTQMEPNHANTFLNLANVCFAQEDYPAMAEAAKKPSPSKKATPWPTTCWARRRTARATAS